MPALISGLSIHDKNKAIISFLSLMNLYKKTPQTILNLIEQEQQFVNIIELLIICLKDSVDSDFI